MPRKVLDVSIFLLVYAVTITYFVLKTYGDPVLFSEVIAFAIMATVSLCAALYTEADESYYQNLTGVGLLYIGAATAGMLLVSMVFQNFVIKSVLAGPTVFAQLVSTGQGTSIFTLLLGEAVFQFAVVGAGEELLKFAAYTEIKQHYGSVVLAVVVAVGLWASYHMLLAYSNVLLVVPAFLCGLIMLGLLEVTKSFLAPAFAHGLYNTIVFIVAFRAGDVPVTVPWLPTSFTAPDVILIGLAAVWIGFLLLPVIFRRNK